MNEDRENESLAHSSFVSHEEDDGEKSESSLTVWCSALKQRLQS